MKRTLLFHVPLIALIIAACSSGKRMLEHGQYDAAVFTAVNRLRQDPNNGKAGQTLSDAYKYAKDWHMNNINTAKQSNDPLKWDKVVWDYSQMNALAQEIQTCPSCLQIVPTPVTFSTELNDAKWKAAEVHYVMGDNAMQTKSRQSARDAYNHFLACYNMVPTYKDITARMNESKFYATLKVMVPSIPMHSNQLKISNEFFDNKIHEFLVQMPVNEFVKFYNPKEAEAVGLKQPDQIIYLTFDDFVVGQTLIKETVLPCKKDSVQISKDAQGKPIYGTVTAELHKFNKTVVSSGLLDFKVVDPNTQQVLTQEKFPGTFNWFCEWGYFNGDIRSLTPEQVNLTKNKEMMPPPPQDLFINFCKPIYDQVTGKIKVFYQNY